MTTLQLSILLRIIMNKAKKNKLTKMNWFYLFVGLSVLVFGGMGEIFSFISLSFIMAFLAISLYYLFKYKNVKVSLPGGFLTLVLFMVVGAFSAFWARDSIVVYLAALLYFAFLLSWLLSYNAPFYYSVLYKIIVT